jgi:hypothetical protein
VTEEYIPRERPDLSNLVPGSPKQKRVVRNIESILKQYTDKDVTELALRIWRVTKR